MVLSGFAAALGMLGCSELESLEPVGEGDGSAGLLALGATAQELGTGKGGAELEPFAAFVPIHLVAGDLLSGAPNLLVTTATTINTTALTINGSGNAYFVVRGSYAVLFTNAFYVQSTLTITGARPLIVVANDQATIGANINLSASGVTPGPGADSAGAGGAGTSFLGSSVRESSGGGGGSFGTFGASGGGRSMTPPGLGGPLYGASIGSALVGGSPGGIGGWAFSGGGAGGGALQITSQVAISMGAVTINAAGGGGAGGGVAFVGGGGGGSGGQILLEAPSILSFGVLAANGGGGGGGGSGGGGSSPPGTNGANGAGNTSPALGGVGGVPQGSPGGNGAAGATAATAGDGFNSKGGGGGGGGGRIWLRYRAATPPNISSATISPAAGFDSTLPP